MSSNKMGTSFRQYEKQYRLKSSIFVNSDVLLT